MAKIQFTIGEIKGRVGGLVYSRNLAGAYVKNNAVPVDRHTAKQQLQRIRMGQISEAWYSLTEDQRSSWNSTVIQVPDRFGLLRNLTGRQLFFSLNRNKQTALETLMTAPPVDTSVPALPDSIELHADIYPAGPYADSFQLSVDWSWNTPPAEEKYFLSTAPPLRMTRYSFYNDLALLTAPMESPGRSFPFHMPFYMTYGILTKSQHEGKVMIGISVQRYSSDNGITSQGAIGHTPYGSWRTIYPI